ncbi:hypothetical protein M419DRAFT_92521 [Trichoderma reesei RUT C-30]|uniref:Uncharacterized protein n=1 Tax=Hypocrea jecorina (strain ATCC 56765 / BCRC 32924 / NRRL 11460 / Rut C-30) TaxID=1344414 RepID=A0A024RYP8_HYPJR|nr:hypothetical protein M419DRAFT_92521 [Trichoderma reesei RUT C-30]
MPLVLDPRTSSPPQYTTLFQITTQQTTLATQTTVPTDTVYTPLPTTTDEPPSQTNTSGLSTQAKIGLESGIALGVLAVVVAIGLCAYGFSCRKSEKDSDTIRSYSPEPGTPQASMLDLPSQHMYGNSGLRYEAITNTHLLYANSTNLPQKAPLVFGHRINRDQSSNPLIYTAELDEGDTWDRYPRVSELQSGPYVKLPANARRAELESNHTRNPAVMHKIPRKEVQSHTHREPLLQSEVSVWPA